MQARDHVELEDTIRARRTEDKMPRLRNKAQTGTRGGRGRFQTRGSIMNNNYTRKLEGIDSSNISAIEYTAGDPEADFGTMTVRFNSGVEYDYSNVSAKLADEFFEAESKGSFFHSKIRNSFIGVKREEVPEEPTETRYDRQRVADRLTRPACEAGYVEDGEEF